ncbi:MAG: RNA methyltransferase [Dehalococcoidia bacterium]|nr:RNA methyltransferase [Dehalococcoidia bacterium]
MSRPKPRPPSRSHRQTGGDPRSDGIDGHASAAARQARGRSGRTPHATESGASAGAACYALVVPGLDALAAAELRSAGARVAETLARFDRRDSLLLFDAPELAPVVGGRLVEDVFRVVLDASLPRARNVPAALARLLGRDALDSALAAHRAIAPKRRGRSYRIVVRMAGQRTFRREEVEASVGRRLGELLPHWVWTLGPAGAELWVHIIGTRAIIGLRLTDDAFAGRPYKRAHLPASLKPTVARALVAWSAPRPNDVVVDPMAGAGTILRERADAAPAKLIAGGDRDAVAVAAARTNGGRLARTVRWDATRLPLRAASVDAIITNPPYGRQHDAPPGVERLYRAVLREAARVLRPGGRCVLLTGEPAALERALPAMLRRRAVHRLRLRGLPVSAFVLERR